MLWAIAIGVSVLLHAGLHAQSSASSAIHGVTTTQSGRLVQAGVVLQLFIEPGGARVATVVSDAQGRYRISPLPPGAYRLRARLEGFREVTRDGVTVARDQDLELDVDIALAVDEHVEASVRPDDRPITGTSSEKISGDMIDIAPVKGDDFQALLPLLPGVVRGPDGRINMKGGRPTQTGLQVSNAYVNDPSTGNPGFELPVDAVESIEVLPNPYAAEYGRFSSGVTKIETRKGTDQWRASATDFVPIPCLKLCDLESVGIRAFDPRLIFGGPIVPGRLLFSQSLQYHDHRERVPSLPDSSDDMRSRSLNAFTRLDANAGASRLTATAAFFPRNLDFVNLNTFNPQPVTPTFRQRGYDLALSDATQLTAVTAFETTVNLKQYNVGIGSQGDAGMTIAPGGNSGNFFNSQERRTRTAQWIGSVRTVRQGAGDHLIKAGADLLHLSFDGSSDSRPVEIVRENGTLAERIGFLGPTIQQVTTTDVGAFVQDTWRWNDRTLVELGVRADRDGVVAQTNISPRLGFVIAVLPDGAGIVRGGAGLFYERTPLLVGAFDHLDQRTVTRFGADGSTTISPAVVFANRVSGPLSTPSGRVWNIEYDYRPRPKVLLKVNHLERSGRHEYLVEPVEAGAAGEITLASDGRSEYRETEFTAKYDAERGRQLTVTYVRSGSYSDLNSFDAYFGNFRNPIVRPNQYARTGVDVPNRLIVLGVFAVRQWRVAPLLELRNGFPYSVVNEDQDFVGPRNDSRFPVFASLDLNVSRAIVIRGRNLRLGLRANHLLNNWTPRDVQNNLASPAFGTFYNSIVPRFGFTLEFRR